MKGILFRKIDNEEQLAKYHERIPVEYIVQDLIELPGRSKRLLLPLSLRATRCGKWL